MKLSERLKMVLEEKDMKPADLSEVTGISKSSISEWLKDKYQPKQDNIFLVAEALSISPAWLMGKDVPKEWHTNPYTLIQSYIRELVRKGEITDPDLIPSSVLIRLNELNTRCMVQFISEEIQKSGREGRTAPKE